MVNLVGVDPVSVVLELISRDDAEEVAGLLLRVMVQKHDIVSEFIANISQQRLLSGIVERDDFDDILDQLTRIRTEVIFLLFFFIILNHYFILLLNL